MTTRRTLSSAAFVAIAAVLSAATLSAAVIPAIDADAHMAAVIDLPAVHVSLHRVSPQSAVIDLPRVVVEGHRVQSMAIVDLPRVVITAHRSAEPTDLLVAGR